MYAPSTNTGKAVIAFPDVCKTPGPGGSPSPVPIPYPTATGTAAPTRRIMSMKAPLGFPGAPTPPSAMAAQLKSKLATLHGQILALPGTDPNRWHSLLDQYVIGVADLYIALAGG